MDATLALQALYRWACAAQRWHPNRGRPEPADEVRAAAQALGLSSLDKAWDLARMLVFVSSEEDASPCALQRAYALWRGDALLCPRHPALRRYAEVLLQVRKWAMNPPHQYSAARDARVGVYVALFNRWGHRRVKRRMARIVEVLRWYDAAAAYAPWAIETRGAQACRAWALEKAMEGKE